MGFALALHRAQHERNAELNENTVRTAAREADLDLADDAGLREALAAALQDSAALSVFDTPTFVLPDGNAAYLRFSRLTLDGDEALAL